MSKTTIYYREVVETENALRNLVIDIVPSKVVVGVDIESYVRRDDGHIILHHPDGSQDLIPNHMVLAIRSEPRDEEPDVQRHYSADLLGLSRQSRCEVCGIGMNFHRWADLDKYGTVVKCSERY